MPSSSPSAEHFPNQSDILTQTVTISQLDIHNFPVSSSQPAIPNQPVSSSFIQLFLVSQFHTVKQILWNLQHLLNQMRFYLLLQSLKNQILDGVTSAAKKQSSQSIQLMKYVVVHWKKNLFKIPSGKHGKAFVQEIAKLFQAYADASSLELIARKAAMICPQLILQKPNKTSKLKDHIACI